MSLFGPEFHSDSCKYTSNAAAPKSLIISAKTLSCLKVSRSTAFGLEYMQLPADESFQKLRLQPGHRPRHDHASFHKAFSRELLQSAAFPETFLYKIHSILNLSRAGPALALMACVGPVKIKSNKSPWWTYLA
jgi:hypothetical protein